MSEQNDQIILAALSAAGPIIPLTKEEKSARKNGEAVRDPQTEWDQNVKAIARNIKTMLRPDSEINKQLKALDKCFDPDSSDGKSFMGTIMRSKKEPGYNGKAPSQRALVTLFTDTQREQKGLPMGFENVRTDRTDNPNGLAIAQLAASLVGHKVIVYIEMEPIKGRDQKARVGIHFEDLGVDPDYANYKKRLD